MEITDKEQMSIEDPERRMWLDYFLRVNDRAVQRARATGATSWALAGVAGAILYQGVPKLPALFRDRQTLTDAGLFLFFCADAILSLWTIYRILLDKPLSLSDGRLYTEREIRAGVLNSIALSLAGIILVAGHVWIAVTQKGIVQSLSFPFLTLFSIMGIADIVRSANVFLKEYKFKTRVPRFPSLWRPGIGMYVFFLMLFGIATTAVIIRIRELGIRSEAWVLTLGTAAQLITLVAIGRILIRREIEKHSRQAYELLERDILLQGLSASQIRTRFISEALGPSVLDVYGQVGSLYREVEEDLRAIEMQLKNELADISKVEQSYKLEREGRAKKALAAIEGPLKIQEKRLDQIYLLIPDHNLLDSATTSERSDVSAFMASYRTHNDAVKVIAKSIASLKQQLRDIANITD